MEHLLLFLLQSVIAPASASLATEQKMVEQKIIKEEDAREIVWLARILYSETKDDREMNDIAWVVRNRVETQFRGTSYEEVATSRNQFSGLNSYDKNYEHNISRTYESGGIAWKHALAVAAEVFYATEDERPFPVTVRHFYSPVAINAPHWAHTGNRVSEMSDVRGNVRFAFYSGVK
ncbi:MAG: cell wall hydrolase [bacterium]|nr:cell wall hydrolase [bacterium]